MESNNADEIIPRLWLGNVKSSQDEQFIKQNKHKTLKEIRLLIKDTFNKKMSVSSIAMYI